MGRILQVVVGLVLIATGTVPVQSDCPDGRTGRNCNNTCPSRCKTNTCDQYSQRCHYGCEDGFWGSTCVRLCPSGCNNSTCDRWDGTCTFGCGQGFYETSSRYEPNCLPCPENCKRCRDSTTCLECDDGKYGDDCQRSCSAGCQRCVATYTGSWSSDCIDCLPQHYGYDCMFNCSYCADGLCSRDNCINGCIDGWQEYQSRMCVRCPSTCETCDPWSWNDRKCVTCPTGTWGDLCDNHCPASCANNTCNQQTGQCECVTGSYLDIETNVCMECPGGCLECTSASNCTRCSGGRYGSACEESCVSNCLECSSEPEYNEYRRVYSQCKRCQAGYYNWDRCHPCEAGCSACWWMRLSNILECTACYDGYYRDVMQDRSVLKCYKCPTGCKTCNAHGECQRCFEGWFLSAQMCCPRNCIACSSPTSCSSCREGYYGSSCNVTTSQ